MSDIEKTIECSCGCTIVKLDYWAPHEYDPAESMFVDFFTRSAQKHWRYKLKTAWRVLTGGDHYLDAVMFERPQVERLRDWCDEVLADRQAA